MPVDIYSRLAAGDGGTGVAVDLTAVLLRESVLAPADALTTSVDEDETARWYVVNDGGRFVQSADSPVEAEVMLLVRTPEGQEPAWHRLLRDQLHVDGFAAAVNQPAGAIIFVPISIGGRTRIVAWCFGQGSRWIRRKAVNPRFGLLAALNAMAGSIEEEAAGQAGVVGASLAARDGLLKRASLTTAAPTSAHGIPRIDTLADVLLAARIHTGNEVLGQVTAGRSLQFPAVLDSIEQLRELSDLIAGLSRQDAYLKSDPWIGYVVPELDDSVVEAVLERIWKGADDDGQIIHVDIAWWEDVREAGADHPVSHWRLAGERKEKLPSRRVTLTWPGLKSLLGRSAGTEPSSQSVLSTDIRFFAQDETELGRCPAIELLSSELSIDGTTYVLADGEVCRVNTTFLDALNRELACRVVPSTLVPYRPGELEAAYNKRASAAAGMLCLDTTDIRPRGETQIEPCDILGLDGTQHHVKRHTTATGISHVGIQAIASAKVLVREPESRRKLAALIQDGAWATADKQRVQQNLHRMAQSAYRLPVVIAIVGEWRNPTVASLSLLSRMALATAFRSLRDVGIDAHLMLIGPA
jgi:uncharacterized protein (TIGR04141 family)